MDYFYHDALRWSFGFENPNKAAALLACGLAVGWTLWALAWRAKMPWIRGMAIGLAAGLVLATAFLLFKTYSRGGALAGGAALVYLAIRSIGTAARRRERISMARRGADFALRAAALGLFWATGLADRSLEPLQSRGDASVENRLVLWRSALQMAADNPGGFGAGESGAAYMNWYQPVEEKAGYRTMVNSYLTALVEWGWPAFGAAAALAAFCWGWGDPGPRSGWAADVVLGLRAVVLAFAVAGIFSTTMESWGLWILPVACLLVLLGWSGLARQPFASALPSMMVAAAGCAALYGAGWFWSARDGERREFPSIWAEEKSIRIGRRDLSGDDWIVVPDETVLGASYGKLLRLLADDLQAALDVRPMVPPTAERLILAGRAVNGGGGTTKGSGILILLAPEVSDPARARELLSRAARAVIFLPDIDEDGRSAFWSDAAASCPGVNVVTIEGVGRQLDWGWDQVLARLAARESRL